MKVEDGLLVGALALGGLLLYNKVANGETTTPQIISSGGGGAVTIPGLESLVSSLGSLGSSLTSSLGSLAQVPQGSNGLDFSGIYSLLSGLTGKVADTVKLPDISETIPDKITQALGGVTSSNGMFSGLLKGISEAKGNISQLATNVGGVASGATGIAEALSETPRTIIGGTENFLKGNTGLPKWVTFLAPGVAYGGGLVQEMKQIATEKNPYMQYTVKAGPATRATANQEAAAIIAGIKAGTLTAGGMPIRTETTIVGSTPQHRAMAMEVSKGKTAESPSAGETALTRSYGGFAGAFASMYAAAALVRKKKQTSSTQVATLIPSPAKTTQTNAQAAANWNSLSNAQAAAIMNKQTTNAKN